MENLKLLGILTILIIIVKPSLGLDYNFKQDTIPVPRHDLPSSVLGARTIEKGKMKLALERPMKQKQPEIVKPKVEVASITHYKSSVPDKTPTPPADLNNLIEKYASEYNANPNLMKSIAKCESGFRAEATNGNFGGMYQFLASTWSSNRKAMGLDPDPSLRFNAEEAIKTAAFKMGRDGYGAWPSCYRKALAQI